MKPLLFPTIFLGLVSSAAAHPGAHQEVTGWETAIVHWLASPFHLALTLAAIGLAVAALRLYFKGQKSR